jgi:hypothetical protein
VYRARRLAPALAASLAAIALALPAPAAATHTSTHVVPAYGLNALRAEGLADFTLGLGDLQLMGQNNVGMYRARFRQDVVKTVSGYTNWTQLDNLARQAALRGVTLAPVLMNLPGEVYQPPKTSETRTDFAKFAAAAARRYGLNGSFWPSCGCPKRPVRVWEVWNEANMSPYWDPPNPTQFALLVARVRGKLRQADPTARIMAGGLAYASSYDGTTRLEPNAYLRSVLQTVGQNGFDALAIHTYHGSATSGVNAIGATVATLKTYGGTRPDGSPRHQVWVNEFGRSTKADDPATPTVNEQTTTEETQRAYVAAFLDRLLPNRAAWNLGPVFAYAIRDSHVPTEAWHRLGLRRTNANDTDAGPKPAWDAYTSRSRPAPLLDLPALR